MRLKDSLLKKFKKLAGNHDKEENKGFSVGEKNFEMREPSGIITLPDIDDITEVDIKYPLLKAFAQAHVIWNEKEGEVIYNVEEPELNLKEEKTFSKLKKGLEEKIETSLSTLKSKEETIEYLEGKIDDIIKELGLNLTSEEYMKIMYLVYRDFVGLNEIEPLMHDPYIEDIGVDGTGIPIFIVHSKFGNLKTNIVFEDEENLRSLVIKLAERCGKYISYANPIFDGSLPDGSRVNASLTRDVTSKGPTISIRKFQETPYSAINMIDLGTSNFEMMAYLWFVLEHDRSILVSGGTATGKTSFLNSIVTFIPPEEKIISIEDTRELQLPHENWVPSIARSGYSSHEEDVSMYHLLEESFRQNPDYVVVGEVRGEEASVLFQGMSSGHPSLGTMHASSPSTVIKRLITPPINLSPTLVETLDMIIIMNRAKEVSKNSRRVQAIYEIEKVGEGESARTNEIFSWTPVDDTFEFKGTNNSVVFDAIQRRYGLSKKEIKEEIKKRKKILRWMNEQGIDNFHEVSKIVSEYYKDKKRVLNAMKENRDPFRIINRSKIGESGEKSNENENNLSKDSDVKNTSAEEIERDMSKRDFEGNPFDD